MITDRNLRRMLAALAVLGAGVVHRAGGAQEAPAPPAAVPPAATPVAEPVTAGELARLEGFLDQHPNIEERLRENPALTDNAAFQKNHPQLAQFLARHPGIAAELSARPRWFIHREIIRQSAGQVTRGQLAEFDRFLDQHPGVEKQLRQRPRLLRQPDFLTGQPELREFVRLHPAFDRAGDAKADRLRRFERKN